MRKFKKKAIVNYEHYFVKNQVENINEGPSLCVLFFLVILLFFLILPILKIIIIVHNKVILLLKKVKEIKKMIKH